MPKDVKCKTKRPCALDKQLAYDAKPFYLKKKVKDADVDSDEEDYLVPSSLTEKTLKLAREQQMEIEMENDSMPLMDNTEHEVDSEEEDEMVKVMDGYVEEQVEISEMDEQALEQFMKPKVLERRNLADIIMEKIQEKEALDRGEIVKDAMGAVLNPKIVQVYQGVGGLLKRYTSGKLPKAFKVIPSLSNWEEILWLTHPEDWSPHAMYAATRLFASNLNPKMAQRFFNIFLLEHVRQDIRENKRLNFHLYMALKKALYKPQAFFKGVILPLCEGQDCTLREAAIIGSVLAKISIPVIHSAAALMKLSKMSYSGSTSMFISVLLNKKYSLPTRVVEALCNHFLQFRTDTRTLPVLWHQSLLTFAQRYKQHIPTQVKEQLKQLLKQHQHHMITAEIRRELFADH